jgi:hypothetical protein
MGLSSMLKILFLKKKDIFFGSIEMNLIGRRIKETKAFCCLNCRYPVLLVGRLVRYLI